MTAKTSRMEFNDMSMSIRCSFFCSCGIRIMRKDSRMPSITGRESVMSVQIAATPIAPAPMKRTLLR